jgi:hypothetical protein
LPDLLECVWPAVLAASGSPFRSASWRASLTVVLDRAAGDLSRVHRLGLARFTVAVRRELPRCGATRPCLRIVTAVFDALVDPARVPMHCPGALERAELVLGDWRDTRRRLADVDPHGGRARRTRPDRAGHLDRRADRRRRRGHPDRDR